MTGADQRISHQAHLHTEKVVIRVGISVAEVQLRHSVDRDDMNMGMWHLEAGDQETDSTRREDGHLRPADCVGHLGEMCSRVSAEVGPSVGLFARHHQRMPWGERAHVEETDTDVVLPQHARRNVPFDDLGEDSCHHHTLEGA